MFYRKLTQVKTSKLPFSEWREDRNAYGFRKVWKRRQLNTPRIYKYDELFITVWKGMPACQSTALRLANALKMMSRRLLLALEVLGGPLAFSSTLGDCLRIMRSVEINGVRVEEKVVRSCGAKTRSRLSSDSYSHRLLSFSSFPSQPFFLLLLCIHLLPSRS